MKPAEFDFKWSMKDSETLQINDDRINELLRFSRLPATWFKGKNALDVGCGVGRLTWALQQLGAEVDSFDISPVGVERTRRFNPRAYVFDLMDLRENRAYDFVISWGVLHHTENPRLAFRKVAGQVRKGGYLLVMLYHRGTQWRYEERRKLWLDLSHEQRLALCQQHADKFGGSVQEWWDAFSPKYNWSFLPSEIVGWFREEGFGDVTMTNRFSVNMRGAYTGERMGFRPSLLQLEDAYWLARLWVRRVLKRGARP